MLLQSIFAFCAIIGFSVLIEAPKRCLVVNGILGMAGWAIYLYTEKYTSMLMATFMSGLVLAIISHILARIMKTPVTTTLIPAILTIVPGAGMYETVYYLFTAGAFKPCVYYRCGRGYSTCYIYSGCVCGGH